MAIELTGTSVGELCTIPYLLLGTQHGEETKSAVARATDRVSSRSVSRPVASYRRRFGLVDFVADQTGILRVAGPKAM